MNTSFKENEERLKKSFASITDKQKIYLHIIEQGKELPTLDPIHMTPENKVQGCQSASYLHTTIKDEKLYFEGTSDALISKGLLALLITLYNGQDAETILKTPPTCLSQLNILTSISLTRINGLNSLYLMMKQAAIQALSRP